MRPSRFILPAAAFFCLLTVLPTAAAKLPAYPETDVNLIAERSNVARIDDLVKNGKYLYKNMRYAEAFRFLDEATNLSAKISYASAYLDAANTMGLLLSETGRTNDSRELLLRLFKMSFTYGKKNLQVISDLLNNLSLVEIGQGRPAAEIFGQLKRAAKINRDPAKALVIENNRCLLLIRTGQAGKAIPLLQRLVRKAERKGYYEPLISGLLRIAQAATSLNNPQGAEKSLHQSLDRAVFWEYRRGIATVLSALSSYYEARGDSGKALEYARALLTTHESMNAAGLLSADRDRIRRLEAGR